MATRVHMEALSPTMEEGQVVKWLKSEGDAVAQGDVLAEIETDKATMELVARGEGALRKIFVGEGGTAPVGDVIAVIAPEGEDIAGLLEGLAGGDGAGAPQPAAAEAEAAEEPPSAAAAPSGPAPHPAGHDGSRRLPWPDGWPASSGSTSGRLRGRGPAGGSSSATSRRLRKPHQPLRPPPLRRRARSSKTFPCRRCARPSRAA